MHMIGMNPLPKTLLLSLQGAWSGALLVPTLITRESPSLRRALSCTQPLQERWRRILHIGVVKLLVLAFLHYHKNQPWG